MDCESSPPNTPALHLSWKYVLDDCENVTENFLQVELRARDVGNLCGYKKSAAAGG